MLTEVIHIIRAAKAGDTKKAIAYAELLAENLDKNGQYKFAARVRDAINGTNTGNPVCLDSIEKDFPGIYPADERVRF